MIQFLNLFYFKNIFLDSSKIDSEFALNSTWSYVAQCQTLSDNVLLMRLMRSENNPESLMEQWSLFIMCLSFVGRKIRALVYIQKRNADRKTTAGSLRFLRVVNESRPIKFLFEVGCRGVITSARYAISDVSPLSGDPYYTVDTWATITSSRLRPAPRCLTSSFVVDEGTLPRFYLTGPSTDFLSSLCLSVMQVLICQKINLSLSLESHDDFLSG